MVDQCLSCKKTNVHLIMVTSHPEKRDGEYCEDCNPYELDRVARDQLLKTSYNEALDDVFKIACKNGSYYADGNGKGQFVIELKYLKNIINRLKNDD
jgi:hypothetical protein